MSKVRCLFFVLAVIAIVDCGQGTTRISHTLPPRKLLKPTPLCESARADVDHFFASLDEDGFADETGFEFLGDGTCTVKVMFKKHDKILPLLTKFKERFGDYTSYAIRTANVALWVEEPALPGSGRKNFQFPPTDAECDNAVRTLSVAFANDDVFHAVKNLPENDLMKRCYIEAVFNDDATFERFFNWTIPGNPSGELLHFNVHRRDDIYATIWIHAIRSID